MGRATGNIGPSLETGQESLIPDPDGDRAKGRSPGGADPAREPAGGPRGNAAWGKGGGKPGKPTRPLTSRRNGQQRPAHCNSASCRRPEKRQLPKSAKSQPRRFPEGKTAAGGKERQNHGAHAAALLKPGPRPSPVPERRTRTRAARSGLTHVRGPAPQAGAVRGLDPSAPLPV